MLDLFNRLLTSLDNFYIWNAFLAVPHLLYSTSLIFWLVVFLVVRFETPNFALYVAYLVNRKAFEPPPLRRFANNQPLISFLIAGRNPGASIISCIESILASNYKNIEIIFADDKSTDNSVELARKFESSGKVRVVANANHSGKAAGLNLALMFARGEFVFILDADSWCFPTPSTICCRISRTRRSAASHRAFSAAIRSIVSGRGASRSNTSWRTS